jgi:thiamine biosynthesis lipoprotein
MPPYRPWPVSEAMADIVTLSLRIGAKTHGAMDITVGPLVNLWGFGPDKQPVKRRIRRDRRGESAHRPAASDGYQQSGRQFCKKISRSVCRSLHRGEGYAADHLAR